MPDATPFPAIVLKDLQKYYPPPRTGIRAYLQPFERATRPALQGVTFEVQEGEAVALLGANGAGKSTILRILATLLIPTRGQAFVSGHDTVKDPRAVRRKLGYHAGSDQGFYPRLSGRQNLLFFGQLNHLTRAQAQNRIAELGEKFHLTDALDQQVRTLSSGTTQRLSLARALLHKPTVLLLDEPTRSLDAIAAAEFRRFLAKEVLRGARTSLLFASHALSEIEQLAHRVAVIHQGQLAAFDTVSGLLARTKTANLEQAFFQLTGSVNLFERFEHLDHKDRPQ
ncbi:MAG TPA: ABC transporter ATP-binding protein [Candidatus Acidoferrum sp.]|nr:ABC transporter ATP-binding protein [Candidatus Acidoferrum sp.]